MSQALKKCC
jgi:hypothetical protein